MFAREIQDRKLIQHVFSEVGPRFENRHGGYTRVIRLGHRQGDGAEMAILELVDRGEPKEAEAKST
jgi:large subunit ribosomal protein L17